MSVKKVARESLEDAFSAPSGPGRRGAGLARMLPPSRAPRTSVPMDPDEEMSPVVRPAAEAVPPRPGADTKVAPLALAPDAPDNAVHTRPVEDPLSTKSVASSAEPEAVSHVQRATPAASPELVTDVDSRDDAAVDADAVENMPIYIDSATLTALKAEKGRIGGTYADVAETALDEQIDAVGEILRRGLANSPQVGAFSSLPKRRKSPQIRGGIQVQLRFTKAQRDWLDEKVAEFGAPSRSVLVAVALQIHLGTRPK